MTDAAPTPRGVLVVIAGAQGEVWAVGADFEPGSPQDHQLARAQGDVRRKFIANHCAAPIAEAMPDHVAAEILRRLERSGFRQTSIPIGWDR